MSVNKPNGDAVIERLRQEIRGLIEQQGTAEKKAALVGMTTEDSEQYKKRHHQIRRLTKRLAASDSEQGAHHEPQGSAQVQIVTKTDESNAERAQFC